MYKTLSSLVLCGLLSSTTVFASEQSTHWGYSGEQGPENWAKISEKYSACAKGKNQSPVNITNLIPGELPEIAFDYKAGGKEIINNGHTIQVNYAPGSTIDVAGHSYELKQFHFHTPSENSIKNRIFPLEGHFVHADAKGNLAVVAVMFEPGATSKEMAKAWAHMPKEEGGKEKLKHLVDANKLLPENHDYYSFNGSLTTPPCTEGVSWYVMKNFVPTSQGEIDQFANVMGHTNNRPIQPLNARLVIE